MVKNFISIAAILTCLFVASYSSAQSLREVTSHANANGVTIYYIGGDGGWRADGERVRNKIARADHGFFGSFHNAQNGTAGVQWDVELECRTPQGE